MDSRWWCCFRAPSGRKCSELSDSWFVRFFDLSRPAFRDLQNLSTVLEWFAVAESSPLSLRELFFTAFPMDEYLDLDLDGNLHFCFLLVDDLKRVLFVVLLAASMQSFAKGNEGFETVALVWTSDRSSDTVWNGALFRETSDTKPSSMAHTMDQTLFPAHRCNSSFLGRFVRSKTCNTRTIRTRKRNFHRG